MLDLAQIMCRGQMPPRPRGPKVAMLTSSGSTVSGTASPRKQAALMADIALHCETFVYGGEQ
jgi:hypothetical protein